MSAAEDPADGLAQLQEEFPGHWIWREITGDRSRYVAPRRGAGAGPHTVVTADLGELRAVLTPPPGQAVIAASARVPNIARMYNYELGGKDHYAADRRAADQVLTEFPEVRQIARANRAFLARAVRYVASQGISQFIDLGAGLPTSPSTHETARLVQPEARVAYVDADEVVLAHARALLATAPGITVAAGDIRDPAAILARPVLRRVIDLAEPVGVVLGSVLHFLPADQADAAVAVVRERMAPGSYLVISVGTSTGTDPGLIRALQAACHDTAPVTGRTAKEITAWFGGLSLVAPGLVDVQAWQPDPRLRDTYRPSPRARFLAGVACKQPASASARGAAAVHQEASLLPRSQSHWMT